MHATVDGTVVVIHDERVDRTTDGSGLVRTTTLDALRELDAGHAFTAPDGSHPYRARGIRIPTLRELLDAHPDVPINVEIKQMDPPIEPQVLAELDRAGARERTLLAAEHGAIMRRIRAAAPDVLTSHSAEEVADFVGRLVEGRLHDYRPPGVAFQVPPSYRGTPIVTADSVRVAHELGVEVHVWTINDPIEMDALLEIDVDAIMTDDPAIAHGVLAARGLR